VANVSSSHSAAFDMVLTISTLNGNRPRFRIATMEDARFSTTLAEVHRERLSHLINLPRRLFNAIEVLSSMEPSPV
jgi:hypothetical protein